MKQSITETITATPSALWPFLLPDRWHLWLATDGPLPRLESAQMDGDTITATAADGQRAVYRVDRRQNGQMIVYTLAQQENAPWPVQLRHTLILHPATETETDFVWNVEWDRPESGGLREYIGNWLINDEIYEMMDLSTWNLKALVENGPTDPDTDPNE